MSKSPLTENLNSLNLKYSYPVDYGSKNSIDVSEDEYSEEFLDETNEYSKNFEEELIDSLASKLNSLDKTSDCSEKYNAGHSNDTKLTHFQIQETTFTHTQALYEIIPTSSSPQIQPQNHTHHDQKSNLSLGNRMVLQPTNSKESGLLDDSSSSSNEASPRKIPIRNKPTPKKIEVTIKPKKLPIISNRTPENKRELDSSNENLANQERSSSYAGKRPQNPDSRIKEIKEIMSSQAVRNRNSWIYVLDQLKNPRIATKIMENNQYPKRFSSVPRGKTVETDNFSSNELLCGSLSKPKSLANSIPFKSPYGVVDPNKFRIRKLSNNVPPQRETLNKEATLVSSKKETLVKTEKAIKVLPLIDWHNTVLDADAKRGVIIFNSVNDKTLLNEHEIIELAKNPWNDGPEVAKITLKARITLDKLKQELLLDNLSTKKSLKAISKACRKLLDARKTITKTLMLIIKRENLLLAIQNMSDTSKIKSHYQSFVMLGNKLIHNLLKFKRFQLFNPKFTYNTLDYTVKLHADNNLVAVKISELIASNNPTGSNLS